MQEVKEQNIREQNIRKQKNREQEVRKVQEVKEQKIRERNIRKQKIREQDVRKKQDERESHEHKKRMKRRDLEVRRQLEDNFNYMSDSGYSGVSEDEGRRGRRSRLLSYMEDDNDNESGIEVEDEEMENNITIEDELEESAMNLSQIKKKNKTMKFKPVEQGAKDVLVKVKHNGKVEVKGNKLLINILSTV